MRVNGMVAGWAPCCWLCRPAGRRSRRRPASRMPRAPDGRRVAVSYLDRIWTLAPDASARPLAAADSGAVEREPAWSPDGTRLAWA